MIRRPPRSTLSSSSAASDVYKRQVHAWYNLSNRLPGTKVIMSPDERLIVTASCVNPDQQVKYSQLRFFDAMTFEEKAKITLGEVSITDILWNREINQIIVGQSDGNIKIFYDNEMSKKGAMQCITRQPRKKIEDNAMCDIVLDPNDYPELHFGEPRKKKKTFTEIRNDPSVSKLPVQPYRKQDKGGRLGVTNTVSQNLMRNLHQIQDTKKEDSQKVLLSLAEIAKNSNLYVNNAYEKTQPKTKFDLISEDHDEQKMLSGIKKICAACGKKVCQCGLKRYV
eukprot:TRINITY_DN4854_c0_g1_i6.p1 TRINITY_DN4854_c0_g1~~TRINITY_DN4854_c0_g1_i6.p1  ORF type:complete len:281 (-),score=54.23 TRINITY_DN4854_c0_g1_i6:31-873(-)